MQKKKKKKRIDEEKLHTYQAQVAGQIMNYLTDQEQRAATCTFPQEFPSTGGHQFISQEIVVLV